MIFDSRKHEREWRGQIGQGRTPEQISTNDTLALLSWGGIGVMIICALIYGIGVAVGLAFGWWAG